MLGDKFLLVADEVAGQIIQTDTETMTNHHVVVRSPGPQVLAYDWLRRDVFWTSATQRHTIFKYSFTSRLTSEFYTDTNSSKMPTHFLKLTLWD